MRSDDLPRLVFLGYQVKMPWTPAPEWDPDKKTGVVDVCSVSDCLAKRPPEWIQHWTHNRAWSYSTREAALETIPADDGDKYNLFAYWAALRTFIDGAWRDLRADDLFGADLPDLPAGPGPTHCDVLGFDVVCWDMGQDLTHSPLSCNLLAREVRVNRYCLVDDLAEALRLVAAFTNENCEPGPYLAVRVARVARG
ncbi:hypothetical protein AnaeK_3328 [Anaeromyxobacter sp. K]|uniref:hypothetical protein n=1 Tax=Anaeromyxobacter sp. (strain K) TaxID=447217 RepID=UPI00015F9E3F|nr:hypothetical protein [Anaeromyxobacter sp. K]ACG74544.1 hypothetical protein AnaeK_3328 [Anaeromyxobacter sp. K]